MYINEFQDIEWKKVCDVRCTHYGNYWYYVNIDRDIMFSPHRSWVYAITDNKCIVKIGESGNPLGIEGAYAYDDFDEYQPKLGTKCRLGRYRKSGDSDEIIRSSLRTETLNNQIEIFAYKCPNLEQEIIINGKANVVQFTTHKHLEKLILDIVMEKDGCYPWLNCGRY